MPDNGNVWMKCRVAPRPYPLRPLVSCLFFTRVETERVFRLPGVGGETKNVLDYQGRAGSTSIVQWTLRPVIFGVENFKR